MNLELLINEELKNAMKNQEKDKLDALRSIKKAIIEFKTSGSGKELDEVESVKLLNQQVKMRRDSIDMYEKAGRNELADKEKVELELILSFLPKQLSEVEIKEVVLKIKSELGIFTRIHTTAPFSRVQHIDVVQSILDRSFGLGKLVIYTAGTKGADLLIPGLPIQYAEYLRDYLKSYTQEDVV